MIFIKKKKVVYGYNYYFFFYYRILVVETNKSFEFISLILAAFITRNAYNRESILILLFTRYVTRYTL